MFNLKFYCKQCASKASPSGRLVGLLILGMFFLPLLGGEGASAQNLVPNPSFEDTLSCPKRPDGTFPANPFTCQNWYNPCQYSSPDYFNACAPHTITSNRNVPNNYPILGWQYAHTGVAYIGIESYDSGNTPFMEFVQTQLLDTLVSQHKYCVEFYINLINHPQAASNNMGIYFSELPIQYQYPWDYFGLGPQINDTNIVTDTVNWVRITGEFFATGGEQYISIGNFYPDTSTDTLHFQNHPPYGAYYYIDDVSVWDCTGSGIGISEIVDQNGIGVYPNPNEGIFEVKSTKYKMKRVEVYNVMGEIIRIYELGIRNESTIKIDISNESSGIYFVAVETEKGILRKKFVKE